MYCVRKHGKPDTNFVKSIYHVSHLAHLAHQFQLHHGKIFPTFLWFQNIFILWHQYLILITLAGQQITMEIIYQVKMIFLVRLMIMQRKLLHLFFTEKKPCKTKLRKQSPRGSLQKRCSANMHQISGRMSLQICNFSKVAKQLYWNHTSAWVTWALEHLWWPDSLNMEVYLGPPQHLRQSFFWH